MRLLSPHTALPMAICQIPSLGHRGKYPSPSNRIVDFVFPSRDTYKKMRIWRCCFRSSRSWDPIPRQDSLPSFKARPILFRAPTSRSFPIRLYSPRDPPLTWKNPSRSCLLVLAPRLAPPWRTKHPNRTNTHTHIRTPLFLQVGTPFHHPRTATKLGRNYLHE